ncbi:MAG: MBOAT family protein [Sandaracinaceae bacterium]|nr:MBOAT family protein [Sandaracinaceae bacterium]
MLFNSLDYLAFVVLSLAGYWGLHALELGAKRRSAPARGALALFAVWLPIAIVVLVALVPGGVLGHALHRYLLELEPRWQRFALHPLVWIVPLALATSAGTALAVLAPEHAHTRLRHARLAFGFVASCLFYMAWSPLYIGLVLSSTVLDYAVARRIHTASVPWRRRAWLALSLAGGLGLLGTFKYYDFLAQSSATIAGLAGIELEPRLLRMVLPVGISFYTFETLSYTIDVYRKQIEPEKSFLRFGFFVMFSPHLVAGPIIRAAEFLPQLRVPAWLSRERVSQAIFLIGMGILKKVVFADFISVNLVDRVFDDPQAFTATEVVIGLYGFTLQIYADFSGYTDVARGTGLLFGIELPENFDRPYQARNVAEFWRRWHMTLSTWLRDYLYYPLGGSRRGELRTYVNLWITIFLIGLWHGASWTFVLYGNLQASAVILNRILEQLRTPAARRPSHWYWGPIVLYVVVTIASWLAATAWADPDPEVPGDLARALAQGAVFTSYVVPGVTAGAVLWTAFVLGVRRIRKNDSDPAWLDVVRIVLTLQFVVFSRILFRASDLDNAFAIVRQLGSGTSSTAQVSGDVWRVLVLGFYLHYVPREQLERARRVFVGLPWWAQGIVVAGVSVVIALFVTEDVVPYIYFQF